MLFSVCLPDSSLNVCAEPDKMQAIKRCNWHSNPSPEG